MLVFICLGISEASYLKEKINCNLKKHTESTKSNTYPAISRIDPIYQRYLQLQLLTSGTCQFIRNDALNSLKSTFDVKCKTTAESCIKSAIPAEQNMTADVTNAEEFDIVDAELQETCNNLIIPGSYDKEKDIVGDYVIDVNQNLIRFNPPSPEQSISENMNLNENYVEISTNILPGKSNLCRNVYIISYMPLLFIVQDLNPEVSVQAVSRKRIKDETKWKRNIIKTCRNSGVSYKDWKGKQKNERQIQKGCSVKCRKNCHNNFSFNNRLTIFGSYWKLGDINRQRDFIFKHVVQKEKCRQRIRKHHNSDRSKNRQYSLYYYFPKDNALKPVCKTFFLDTLSISEQIVKTVMKKVNSSRTSVEIDLRGQCSTKRISNTIRQTVIDHIRKFDKVESHYCRKSTTREYLPSNLNITKMYSLYKEYFQNSNDIATLSMYRHIFNTKFNLHFFKPKKDLCGFCEKFKNSSDDQKNELYQVFQNHNKSKVFARDIKENDKLRCETDKTFCAAVFDLEQVLITPKSEVSEQYYRSKLSTYNLTVFNLGTKQGYCFMWHEGTAQRGSAEVGSCVYNFILKNVEASVKEFSFFSDNCAGQNRNRNIAALYLYCAINYKIKIRHTFLEKGHTQNEGDSIHSVIERAARNIDIYVPSQWYTLARTACKKTPYIVTEINAFFDITDLREKTCNNLKLTTTGEQVKWTEVRMLMFDPSEPHIINIKYEFDKDFLQIDATKNRKRNSLTSMSAFNLRSLYDEKLPINTKKYKHLQKSCKELVIPEEYHEFYSSLSHCD